jgi:general secretion pathway protein L
MAHFLGIDVGSRSVRVALLRTGYRRIAIEAMNECSVADFGSLADAIKAAIPANAPRSEHVCTNVQGDRTFVRVLEIPATALRQLNEVIPFELEAQLPFELDQTVYDTRQLPRSSSSSPLMIMAVGARTDDVRSRIDAVRAATAEPVRVEPSALGLANLAAVVPELAADGPVVLVHLDADLTDLTILSAGVPLFVRTVSSGTGGLPASAAQLSRDLRQTLMAWRATGGQPPVVAYLTGPGAGLSGADAYLSGELGIRVSQMPPCRFDAIAADDAQRVVHFTRAIGLALGLGSKPRGMNLRRGSLAYERGYGFLRERIPVLAGLGALILVSFVFATWSEAHTLASQRDTLQDALGIVTKNVLGEAIRDPQKAQDSVGPGIGGADDDPMPHMDAFDVLVQLSKAVPADVTHDVEELDVQRGHATINGVVPTIPDAQQIATTLKDVSCFKNVKIVRTTQAVNENRQKYVLELDIKCPGEGGDKEKKQTPSEASSAEAAEKAAGDNR